MEQGNTVKQLVCGRTICYYVEQTLLLLDGEAFLGLINLRSQTGS